MGGRCRRRRLPAFGCGPRAGPGRGDRSTKRHRARPADRVRAVERRPSDRPAGRAGHRPGLSDVPRSHRLLGGDRREFRDPGTGSRDPYAQVASLLDGCRARGSGDHGRPGLRRRQRQLGRVDRHRERQRRVDGAHGRDRRRESRRRRRQGVRRERGRVVGPGARVRARRAHREGRLDLLARSFRDARVGPLVRRRQGRGRAWRPGRRVAPILGRQAHVVGARARQLLRRVDPRDRERHGVHRGRRGRSLRDRRTLRRPPVGLPVRLARDPRLTARRGRGRLPRAR